MLKVSNPMAHYEYRLAKQNRKLAEIDLRKAEITACGHADEYLIARVLSRRVMWLVLGFLLIVVPINCIDGISKHRDTTQVLQNCTNKITSQGLSGRCYIHNGDPSVEIKSAK